MSLIYGPYQLFGKLLRQRYRSDGIRPVLAEKHCMSRARALGWRATPDYVPFQYTLKDGEKSVYVIFYPGGSSLAPGAISDWVETSIRIDWQVYIFTEQQPSLACNYSFLFITSYKGLPVGHK